MDMDVRHCNKKPRLNHRPSLPEDLYTCIIAFLFRVCRIKIKDIYLSGEHEDDKYDRAHRHSPLDKVRHIVYLSRTCKRMRDEVRKNAKLDRTRALECLFGSVFYGVSNWYGRPSFFGIECEFYTLTEHFDGKRRKVICVYMKHTQSELKILCEFLLKPSKTTKAMFCITDVDPYDDTDSDSETEHIEMRVAEAELSTAAHNWLTEQCDAFVRDHGSVYM